MGLGGGGDRAEEEEEVSGAHWDMAAAERIEEAEENGGTADPPPPVQLDLLPFSPVQRHPSASSSSSSQLGGFPWPPPPENGNNSEGSNRGLDVNRMPSAEEGTAAAAGPSSPNSTLSPFQMDFSGFGCGGGAVAAGSGGSRSNEAAAVAEVERASSRASDEEENGLTRKKLRLSKEQSAYLEESFKEHNTLNPKQKQALAYQLSLSPRQVEVWFQNRRARTKLKQTEVDCEYLKRCCEKLTEENRRLHKELQDLRTLKTSNSHPFYTSLPATTLTMCPSCERVAAATTSAASTAVKPRLFPFAAAATAVPHQQQPSPPATT